MKDELKPGEVFLPREPIIYEYESPITKIMKQLTEDVVKQEENCLMVSVKESVGFDVDKEELLKALAYDREQYQKGYEDALKKLSEHLHDAEYLAKRVPNWNIETTVGILTVINIIDEMLGE